MWLGSVGHSSPSMRVGSNCKTDVAVLQRFVLSAPPVPCLLVAGNSGSPPWAKSDSHGPVAAAELPANASRQADHCVGPEPLHGPLACSSSSRQGRRCCRRLPARNAKDDVQ